MATQTQSQLLSDVFIEYPYCLLLGLISSLQGMHTLLHLFFKPSVCLSRHLWWWPAFVVVALVTQHATLTLILSEPFLCRNTPSRFLPLSYHVVYRRLTDRTIQIHR